MTRNYKDHRKPPVPHTVRAHKREDYGVDSYHRGHGSPATSTYQPPAHHGGSYFGEGLVGKLKEEKGKLEEKLEEKKLERAKRQFQKQQEREIKRETKDIEDLAKAKKDKAEQERRAHIETMRKEAAEEKLRVQRLEEEKKRLQKEHFKKTTTGRIFSGLGEFAKKSLKQASKKKKPRPKRGAIKKKRSLKKKS